MATATSPNAKQRDEWNNAAGSRWLARHELIDSQIGPLGRRAMNWAAIKPGECVLDIGCGSGKTTFELARRVGETGSAVGVDISALLLEAARKSAAENKLANVRFEEADVQTHRFSTDSFDLAFSRFGVMFFDDPVAAFRNIHSALRAKARLAFVCWPAPQENQFVTIPLAAAARHISLPTPGGPSTPGPFAFADADRVRGILAKSNFNQIQIDRVTEKVGGGSVDEITEMLLLVGPLSNVLEGLDDKTVGAIRADIRSALRPLETAGRVWLDAVAWLVTARS